MSKTFYIATAIPYVNDVPHVGHAMEFIQADVLARYHRQRGDDVYFNTGTDEHGGKILEKAKAEGVKTKEYVDRISTTFKDLLSALDVQNDGFIRTTDANHMKGAEKIWGDLSEHIYKSSYSGMYDQKEESFLTEEESRIIEKDDPDRYATLQKLEEENYFFKLSTFSRQIRDMVENDSLRIVPKTHKNEILQLLKEGLEDISISRPKEKLAWGIPVPGDDTQMMYVWFEALMNYITTLGYPDGEKMKKYWPANVQIVGKDITRFHAAIWPAMLIGLGLDVYKTLYVHGFITMDGKKMSKSVGNVVAPLEIISAYGSDTMRYYFLRHIPSYGDGDFSWVKLEMAYNNELGNELGNLVQRIAKMIKQNLDGVIGDTSDDEHDEGPYHEAIADFRFDKALEYVWVLTRGLNQYLEEQKPWEVAKTGDKEHVREMLSYSVGATLQIAKLLHPFMPQSSAAIQSIFADGVISNYEGVLFPRIHNHTDA